MATRIFYPTSSKDFNAALSTGQRYRHYFGDKRLSRRYSLLLRRMVARQQSAAASLSSSWKEQIAVYRFLHNKSVTMSELIYRSCHIEESSVAGKDILVALDGTSIGSCLRRKNRKRWVDELGVIDDNRSPGFYAYPSLVMEKSSGRVLGVGDISIHTRPLVPGTPVERKRLRGSRRSLPFDEKEGYVWPLVASNTSARLRSARRVTYLMDQGADKYQGIERIVRETGHDLIVRSREDRAAVRTADGEQGRLTELLRRERWTDAKIVPLRGLNHYSTTHDRLIQRRERNALLSIRTLTIRLTKPSRYLKRLPSIDKLLSVVEVLEHSSTVPEGEAPVHWRLLTTWCVDTASAAWEVVRAYQCRWNIEQLFRVAKKQGFDIEHSQLQDPDSLKKQAIMVLKASTQAMELVAARGGTPFIPIETMFDKDKQKLLKKLNAELSPPTGKAKNPHPENSLAWAAWVIARLGNWKGYQSQRPPGPGTMIKGLEKFNDILWAVNLIDDS